MLLHGRISVLHISWSCRGDSARTLEAPCEAAEEKRKRTTLTSPQVLLFNLEEDLGEKENLAAKYPEVVSSLQEEMKALDAEITLNARPPWLEGT